MTLKYDVGQNVQIKKTVNTAYAGHIGIVEDYTVKTPRMYEVRFPNKDILAYYEDELAAAKDEE